MDRQLKLNMTYSTKIPNVAGWWLWKEAENMKPERLLIVVSGDYAEVACDQDVIEATGIAHDEAKRLSDLGAFNYWEMTDCRRMGGLWMLEPFEAWIGKRVRKTSVKPFKSTSKVNTVKAVIPHPHRPGNGPAFTFEEDESIVSCDQCVLVENPKTIERLSRLYEHQKV